MDYDYSCESDFTVYYCFCKDCQSTFPAEQLIEDAMGNAYCPKCKSKNHTENDY